jgi:hypothetical protein
MGGSCAWDYNFAHEMVLIPSTKLGPYEQRTRLKVAP